MNFTGKTVLVTGAAVGIGRACVLRFAEEGAHVVALDYDAEKLVLLQKEMADKGYEILTLVCDVADEKAVNDAFETVKNRFGSVDVLINNAALWRQMADFLSTSADTWKKYLDVNVMGVVNCTRAALPSMLEKRYGRIVNVASVAGVYGNANMVCYSATKGAVIAMTRALAKEVADKGVLVNAVSPGSVSSSKNPDIDYTEESELSFMGRTGSGRENADLILFLAGDQASYISGQNIQIDGCRKKQ